MIFRKSLPFIQKALTMLAWLVFFCLGLGVSSHLSAGENITLAANDKIKIQAASNQMTGLSAEKKKSSAIGLAVEMGGIEGATVGVTGGKSNSNNNSISKEQIWSYSTLTAGENLNLISGGDTDILGAHLDAETINASVGGDLTIASPQNSTQHLGFGESSTTKFAIGPQVMAGGKKDNNAGQITDTVKGVANAFGEDAKSLGEMVKNPSEAGFGSASISVEASLGVSKSSSTSFGVEDQSKGSSISAGGNVNLIATGKDAAGSTPEVPLKEGGNIFIQGSHITGGGDVSLIANKQIDIRAAQNSSFDMGQSKSSSGSISVSYGTQGWGGGVSASKGKGSSIEVDKSWSGSYIDAGGAATLISGGDTNIIGSQVSGDKVQAQIGGDLNIETLQDFSFSHKDEKNSGVSFSTTKGSIGGSVSHSKSNATGLHISASEYAGIMAGDGGYQITVEGNTDLKGGIIASTQEAVNKGKNELTTGSITTSELINISTSKSEGSSISAGASFGWGNTGDNATNNGFKPSTPLSFKGKTDDQDLSITLSGISGGKLTITNEEEQRARTGQSAEEAIASVNTNVKTGQSVNALEKTWDTDKMLGEMQANLEIAEAFTREADQFRANQAKELDQLKLDMKKLEDGGQTHSQEYMDLKAAYEQQNRIWGKGGIGSLVTTALTGALSGNVSGSTSDLLQNAAVNVIQGLGAGQIKDLITHLGKDSTDDGDALRAALQGILGCASASSQGGDCGTGAFGAAGAVIINKVIEDYFKGKEPEGMTEQEKQDRINLVNTIIIGITEAVGGDSSLAKVTATIEMENNWSVSLAQKQAGQKFVGKEYSQQDVDDALCALMRCSLTERDPEERAKLEESENRGWRLKELRDELLALDMPGDVQPGFDTQNQVRPLFEYTDTMELIDKYQVFNRLGDSAELAGGLATAGVGAAACTGSAGVACAAGIPAIVIGFDTANTALKSMLTNTNQTTWLEKDLIALGVPPEYSNVVHSYVELAAGGVAGGFALLKSAKTGQTMLVIFDESAAAKGGATAATKAYDEVNTAMQSVGKGGGASTGKTKPPATGGGTSTGALSASSEAAFNASKNHVNTWIPKDKHMIGTTAKRSAQFNTNDVGEIRTLVKEALNSEKAMFTPYSQTGGIHVTYDVGRTIGTKGQTKIRVTIGKDGKIWNAFPTH